MLFTKTVCNAGSLVYIVPTGLLVTLRYDAHGMIFKAYQGFIDKEDLGESFVKSVVKQGLVPSSIKLHGGTTDIQGVFYSNEIKADGGTLPECEFARIAADIESGSPKYRFYVANVESGAMAITPASMQSWTKMVGFNSLPCWAVPINANDEVLKNYLSGSVYANFEYPLISGFMVFEGQNKGRYVPINLETFTVADKVTNLVDYDGYIKCGLRCNYIPPEGSDESIVVDRLAIEYPEAVKYNIQKGSQVVISDNKVIWSNTKNADSSTRLAKRISCSSCHKILDVPDDGPMMCDDPFCTSRLYPRIKRFCTILGLEILSTEDFDAAVKSGDLTILPDLLLLPKYKDIRIAKHLSEIILACMDGYVGMNRDWMIKFCNKCNNSYNTVKYYLEGPIRIRTELDMMTTPRFITWANNPRNLVELETVINSEQISIINSDKIIKFDGPPILRNKKIMITGTFLHGSTEDIIAILNSYSAEVVTKFDKKVQCVVVGDIKENIDGLAIQAARELDLPMFDESAFFARYSIDEDLEKFLK